MPRIRYHALILFQQAIARLCFASCCTARYKPFSEHCTCLSNAKTIVGADKTIQAIR
jgi:hypothetical protein